MSDVNIKMSKQDKALMDNLIKLLSKSTASLEGVEILAAADAMRWLTRLQKQVEEELQKPPVSNIKENKKMKKPKGI